MECHKCPHAEDVAAGKYARVPYEETPCGSCELKEVSLFTLAYDESRAKTEEPFIDSPNLQPSPAGTEDDRLPVSVMAEAVGLLLRLPRPVRDVVCQRFMGTSYREIARSQGVTVGAVENRHRRAMQRWPELRALFAEKAAKQIRRKPHGIDRGTEGKQGRVRVFRPGLSGCRKPNLKAA